MRLELVLIGAALIIVGSFFLFEEKESYSYDSGFYGFGSSMQMNTSTQLNPFGLVVVLSGVTLMVLGFVLRRADPPTTIPPGVVYYVPQAAPPAPAHAPAAAAPPASGDFATPIPGASGTVPPSTRMASEAEAPPATAPPAQAVYPSPPPKPALPEGPQALLAGARILDEKFEVLRPLGQGTFGGTYLARDLLLDRHVVLKELLPQWRDDPEVSARFVKEAKVVGSLRHPNITNLYSVEKWGEGLLLVMEFVDGGSLAQELREKGRLQQQRAVGITSGVLAALEVVHERGILHRDVKPSNILLTKSGEPRLADFGIAYAPDFGATASHRAPGTSHPGSLPFMAPEQVMGLELDRRTDLYAVGATLYYLVVGAPYVDLSGKTQEAMRRTVLEEPPRLPVEGLSDEMNAFLQKALSKRPSERFSSAAEMREWLPAK